MSYAIGDLGQTIGWGFLSGYVTFYMTNYVGIPIGITGMVIMVSRFMDAFSDVIVGSAMDRTKSRFGKARPWLIYGALPLTITFILLFSVPDFSETGKLLWFIILYNITVTIFYTAVNVPYNALTPLITRDPQSRVRLGATRMLLGILASTIVSAITLPVINGMGGTKGAWSTWATIVGIFMGVCIIVCGLLVRERYSGDIGTEEKEKRSLKDSFKHLLKNKYWIILTLALVINYALQAAGNGINIYYFKYILGNENSVGLAGIALALPMLVLLILVPLLAKKVPKGTLARISAIGALAGPLVVLINPESMGIVILRSTLNGLFMAPITAVGFAMIADVSDYGYWKSGVKCEGLVNSAVGFGTKVGMGLGTGLLGWILSMGGFNADLAVQPDSAIFAMKFCMIGVPIIMALLQFTILWFYRLDKEYPIVIAEIQKREKDAAEKTVV
ncbi:glycoside-pentoside-hexuronide (GPH):cation symporter [Ruminococcaceae bacterium OttesenSCG-928-D13]|nr:glycoside-pentoside-hexuronide (GPH):cation symporter [Ruminococcaceae bacterium OttesenSCG-928-D13]